MILNETTAFLFIVFVAGMTFLACACCGQQADPDEIND